MLSFSNLSKDEFLKSVFMTKPRQGAIQLKSPMSLKIGTNVGNGEWETKQIIFKIFPNFKQCSIRSSIPRYRNKLIDLNLKYREICW